MRLLARILRIMLGMWLLRGVWGWQREHSDEDSAVQVVISGIVFGLIAAWSAVRVLQGELRLLPVFIGAVALFQPWAVCRRVLVPLGLMRAAYWLGRASRLRWAGDTEGAALLAATLAVIRRPTPERWAWLEARRRAPAWFGPGSAFATALARDARGETDRARWSMEQLAGLDNGFAQARGVALEWLAAEAVGRGDWKSAARWGLHPCDDATPARTLIGRLAARRVEGPSELEPDSRPGAVVGWLSLRTFGALRGWARWMRETEGQDVEVSDEDAESWMPEDVAPHDAAILLHARALQHPQRLTASDLLKLGQAWARALEGDDWSARARALGTSGAAVASLEGVVTAELGEVLRASRCNVGPLLDDPACPEVLREAAAQLRSDRLGELEDATEALRRRADAEVALPPADEWTEWQSIALLYDRVHAQGGAEDRAVAFQIVHSPLCSLGVWLWNREHPVVGHAIFKWLLAEAIEVGDEAAIELQKRNASLD